MKGEYSIRLLCEVLEASPSGYYHWVKGPVTKRKRGDAILAARIAAHHRQSRGNYGAPRIVEDLREEGLSTSRRRCARIMKSMGLRGKKKHRRKPRTTDSRHDKPVAPNRLAHTDKSTAK